MEKLVLFESQGVIHTTQDEPIASPDQFILIPNVQEAFFELERNKINGIILFNDLPLGDGLSETDWNEIRSYMMQHIEEGGGRVHEVIVRTQAENTQDNWRYPEPLLLQSVASRMGIDLPSTFFITSQLASIQAGWSAGCRNGFVKTGKPYKTIQYMKTSEEKPEFIVPDLLSAAIKITRAYNE